MLQIAQIEELERAMREEHQRDLEALSRLKRFLPANGKAPVTESPVVKLPLIPSPPKPLPLPESTMAVEKSMRARVAEIMARDQSTKWSAQAMVAHLLEHGHTLAAKKPVPGIQLIMVHWVKRGKLDLLRKGTGRTPNLYRWRSGATLDADGEGEV